MNLFTDKDSQFVDDALKSLLSFGVDVEIINQKEDDDFVSDRDESEIFDKGLGY